MPGILPDQPQPHQLPPTDAGIVAQFARGDMVVSVCAACGAVVAQSFEERHAATHAEIQS
jgi:hypothetical protein